MGCGVSAKVVTRPDVKFDPTKALTAGAFAHAHCKVAYPCYVMTVANILQIQYER